MRMLGCSAVTRGLLCFSVVYVCVNVYIRTCVCIYWNLKFKIQSEGNDGPVLTEDISAETRDGSLRPPNWIPLVTLVNRFVDKSVRVQIPQSDSPAPTPLTTSSVDSLSLLVQGQNSRNRRTPYATVPDDPSQDSPGDLVEHVWTSWANCRGPHLVCLISRCRMHSTRLAREQNNLQLLWRSSINRPAYWHYFKNNVIISISHYSPETRFGAWIWHGCWPVFFRCSTWFR